MTLNHVSREIAIYIRLGGHIFGGVWIATASLARTRLVKAFGVLQGLLLCGYTFVSPFVPMKALSATAFLYLIWLGLIVWQNGVRPMKTTINVT